MPSTAFHPSIHVASHTEHAEFPLVERLIVLRPPIGDAADVGEPAAAGLLLSLMSKAARVAIVENAPAVMVELKRGADAVVLLEQATTPTIVELVAAVSRYYPRVAIWRSGAAEANGEGPLVRLASTISVSAASQPAHAGQASPRQPVLPLPAPSEHSSHEESLISEEELAMLMGPLPRGEG